MKKIKKLKHIKHHSYIHLLLVFLGLIFTVVLYFYQPFHAYIAQLGNYGYIGAFFSGMLFVSTFTAATGALVLLILAEKLSPLELGLIAGLGATITDFMIFHFIKDGLMGEIEDLYTYYGHSKLHHLVHTLKSMRWMFPLLGAIIIASPLPDELGIGLMGISKIGKYKFLFLSFVLNSIGIMAILLLSTIIQP